MQWAITGLRTAFCTGGRRSVHFGSNMEWAIGELADLGYDGLEFWDYYLSRTDLQWLSEVLNKNRIAVAQLCPYFDFVSGKERWEESIQIAEKYIEWCRILGAPLIRVFTGGNLGSAEATKEQWNAAVNGLRVVCQKGLEEGVWFALETHGGSLMDTSKSIIKLLDDVNVKNLGVNLQVPLLNEDIFESAEKIGGYTIHIHAHNWLYGPEGKREMTFLDSGDEDFERFLRILYSEGFNGYISIEHATHGGKHDPMQTAKHEINYLKDLTRRIQKM